MRSASICEVLGEVWAAALLSGYLPAPLPFVSFLVSVGDAWWRVIHSGVESHLGAPPSPNPFAVAWSWNLLVVTLEITTNTFYFHCG